MWQCMELSINIVNPARILWEWVKNSIHAQCCPILVQWCDADPHNPYDDSWQSVPIPQCFLADKLKEQLYYHESHIPIKWSLELSNNKWQHKFDWLLLLEGYLPKAANRREKVQSIEAGSNWRAMITVLHTVLSAALIKGDLCEGLCIIINTNMDAILDCQSWNAIIYNCYVGNNENTVI